MPDTASTLNRVTITGKLADLKTTSGVTKAGVPYLSMRGTIMPKAGVRIPFRNYIQKTGKDGTERKGYGAASDWASSARTIATDGAKEASVVSFFGGIEVNDYVAQSGELRSSTQLRGSCRDAQPDMDGKYPVENRARFQGYIGRTVREVENDEPTGRLNVSVSGIDYWGQEIPLSFIVPENLADAWEDQYSQGQTADFLLEYQLRTTEEKTPTGGIGVQWTEGRSRLELVLLGASAPVDEGSPRAISGEAMKEAKAKRQEMLDRLKEEGYRGRERHSSFVVPGPSVSTGIGEVDSFEMEDDEEFPF